MLKKQGTTPGVFITEVNTLPNDIVALPTAIPAFVGYTEKAAKDNNSLENKPTKITSLADYETLFGKGPATVYDIKKLDLSGDVTLDQADFVFNGEGYVFNRAEGSNAYFLYESIKFFYGNGGGEAYITSVGNYEDSIKKGALISGIDLLKKELEPTMLAIPDTMLLDTRTACYEVQQHMITHCAEMKNRVALLDIYEGGRWSVTTDKGPEEVVELFRKGISGTEGLDYAAAYYPWLNTILTDSSDLNFSIFSEAGKGILKSILEQASEAKGNIKLQAEIAKITTTTDEDGIEKLNTVLHSLMPTYKGILSAITKKINVMPTTGGIAGIYTTTDNQVGVWKAPASIGMNNVVSPTVMISTEMQEGLNVPVNGMAVNAIRTFPGRGTLIWGARTLDGNSPDWRYISSRRTIIFLEQSIKAAIAANALEPNDSNTWISLKRDITKFLTGLWSQGALIGSDLNSAFSVAVGFGETMTAEDVLNGHMRVTVKVAIVRPAEFIVLTFQQQMQEA
jgi:phage tail sheath protein FI